MTTKKYMQFHDAAKILTVIAVVSLFGLFVSYPVYGYQPHYAALIFIVMALFIAAMVFYDKNNTNKTHSK